MRFSDLRYFARNESSGALDGQAAQALQLPMPEDVLEQFIVDHSLKPEFQEVYADLDLYGIVWAEGSLPTAQIVACSSKFDDYVDEVATILRDGADDRPLPHMTPESSNAWFDSGTWRRSPVFLDALLPGCALHLVEGHTRVGVLKGLLRTNIPVRSAHLCWVGRASSTPTSFDWVAVLERHPLSFHSWVFDAIGEETLRGEIANKLLDSESALRYERSFSDTLEGMSELAAADPECGVTREQLVQLAQEWREELERAAGRALRLSP
ncbi:MAG: hypothetical protein ABW061_05475 [Polyangiaceae bacterium]